jgi:serine-type D-Ala-D-Ala carboxypeptidase/endopeptidase
MNQPSMPDGHLASAPYCPLSHQSVRFFPFPCVSIPEAPIPKYPRKKPIPSHRSLRDNMRLYLSATLVILLTSQPLLAQTETVTKQNSALDQFVAQQGEEYLKSNSGVGLSIGIYNAGQMHFYNFGVASKDKHNLPTQDTVYEIGSLSKTFAGILLAQAIIDGKLELNDDIRKYLDGDYPNLEFDGQPIRLVHLANMTSGLPNNLPDLTELSKHTPPADFPAAEARIKSDYTKANFLRDLHQVKLATKPGGDAAHSNAATQLLRYILERVYQTPYENLLARFIEKPLGFQSSTPDTSSTENHAANKIANFATGYDDKGARALPMSKYDFAPGGLRYSTADMLKYVAYQLDEEQKPVKLSHQPTWQTLDNKLAIDFYWIASHDNHGHRLRYSGSTPGFNSFCDLYPEEKIGVVLLVNRFSSNAEDQLKEISERIVATMRQSSSR